MMNGNNKVKDNVVRRDVGMSSPFSWPDHQNFFLV